MAKFANKFVYPINKQFFIVILAAVFSSLLSACNFDKRIDVDLPTYNKQLAVECYIEEGKPIRAFVTETSPYFDTIGNPLLNAATVVFGHNGKKDTLPYSPYFDTYFRKFYNFRQVIGKFKPVVGETYTLEIKDKLGRHLKGEAKYMAPPVIDTIYTKRRDSDSLSYLFFGIKDDKETNNFYRVMVNVDSTFTASQIDFSFPDNNFPPGSRIPVGTNYRFEPGDTLYLRVYNIEKKYYDFLRSVQGAQRANGNPFAQPSVIKSSVKDGFGIFTCLSVATKTIILPKD